MGKQVHTWIRNSPHREFGGGFFLAEEWQREPEDQWGLSTANREGKFNTTRNNAEIPPYMRATMSSGVAKCHIWGSRLEEQRRWRRNNPGKAGGNNRVVPSRDSAIYLREVRFVALRGDFLGAGVFLVGL